jgi:hypothetical protein
VVGVFRTPAVEEEAFLTLMGISSKMTVVVVGEIFLVGAMAMMSGKFLLRPQF